MKIRFQADADLHPAIGLGLLRREPAIDWQGARGFIPDGTPDSEVLDLAAREGRALVSRDSRTMPSHFAVFVASRPSPGIILVPPRTTIRETIERLHRMWLTSAAERIQNQLWWLTR